jgi:uncharacterized protein YegJ (DUF2314 family)
MQKALGRAPTAFSIVQEGDLAEATAEARRTMPGFWSRFESGAADQFQVKAGLSTPHGAVEHVWVEPTGWQDGKLIGRLLTPPADLDDLFLGSEILVDPERLSDWAYFREGKLYGAFTQRALLPQLDRGSRRQLEAVLAPNPTESDHV